MVALLAFIQRTDAELKAKAKQFIPKDFGQITPEEKELMTAVGKENAEMRKKAVAEIQQLAEDYGLGQKTVPNWAENLIRQGIIERTPLNQFERVSPFPPRIHDDRALTQAIGEIHKTLRGIQETSVRRAAPPQQFFSEHTFGSQLHLEVQLTAFGNRFAAACGLI